VPFFAGTGWFVAPALVVTAAHVLDVTNAWNRVPNATQWDLEVIPGIVSGDRPFGSFRANHVEVHPVFRASGPSSHDIALISCVEQAFGPGDCLKLAVNAVENADRVRLSGYPFVVDRGGTPVEGEGPVDAVEDGESGSPILGPSPERSVVGIHLGGTGHGASSIARTRNMGLRMRDELAQWIAQFV
jgi:V8-like Glu-specific endopeptidase